MEWYHGREKEGSKKWCDNYGGENLYIYIHISRSVNFSVTARERMVRAQAFAEKRLRLNTVRGDMQFNLGTEYGKRTSNNVNTRRTRRPNKNVCNHAINMSDDFKAKYLASPCIAHYITRTHRSNIGWLVQAKKARTSQSSNFPVSGYHYSESFLLELRKKLKIPSKLFTLHPFSNI